jgi:hypothetical protein
LRRGGKGEIRLEDENQQPDEITLYAESTLHKGKFVSIPKVWQTTLGLKEMYFLKPCVIHFVSC